MPDWKQSTKEKKFLCQKTGADLFYHQTILSSGREEKAVCMTGLHTCLPKERRQVRKIETAGRLSGWRRKLFIKSSVYSFKAAYNNPNKRITPTPF